MPEDANQSDARPSPDVMRGVIPYLDLNGRAAEAADFYARAFAAKDLGRMPDANNPGRHLHIQVEVNGGALMMTDGMSTEARPGPQGMHLQLVVADGPPGGRARSKRAARSRCPTSGSSGATPGGCCAIRSASPGRCCETGERPRAR